MFLFDLIKNLFCFTGSYSTDVFLEPLSKDEEELCIKNKIKGDTISRNKLIEHNLRLVAHIAKKYESKYISQDDLISIGTIGLIKGVDTFIPSKNVRITTYCARCIDNEILMYFRNNKKNNGNVSLDEHIGYDKDGNEISLLDVLKTPNIDYIENINLKDNIYLLLKYINVLTDREKIILFKRYGLFNYEEETQKEIAKELNISRSYVSRIEKRALTKLLREFLNNKNFEK